MIKQRGLIQGQQNQGTGIGPSPGMFKNMGGMFGRMGGMQQMMGNIFGGGQQQQQPNNPIAPSMPPVPQMGQKGPVATTPEAQWDNPIQLPGGGMFGGGMNRGGIFGGGIAGGYRGPSRQNGLNLPGNQPGMSYLL